MAMRFRRSWDFNPGNKQLDLNSLTQDSEVIEALAAAIILAGGLDEATVQAMIDTSVAALVDSSPEALNTLNELAAALGDDANFAATMTTALAGKADDADLATRVEVAGTIDAIAGPITQAAYDALTPDPNTLYVIVG